MEIRAATTAADIARRLPAMVARTALPAMADRTVRLATAAEDAPMAAEVVAVLTVEVVATPTAEAAGAPAEVVVDIPVAEVADTRVVAATPAADIANDRTKISTLATSCVTEVSVRGEKGRALKGTPFLFRNGHGLAYAGLSGSGRS